MPHTWFSSHLPGAPPSPDTDHQMPAGSGPSPLPHPTHSLIARQSLDFKYYLCASASISLSPLLRCQVLPASFRSLQHLTSNSKRNTALCFPLRSALFWSSAQAETEASTWSPFSLTSKTVGGRSHCSAPTHPNLSTPHHLPTQATILTHTLALAPHWLPCPSMPPWPSRKHINHVALLLRSCWWLPTVRRMESNTFLCCRPRSHGASHLQFLPRGRLFQVCISSHYFLCSSIPRPNRQHLGAFLDHRATYSPHPTHFHPISSFYFLHGSEVTCSWVSGLISLTRIECELWEARGCACQVYHVPTASNAT